MFGNISRRALARLLGGSAAAATLPNLVSESGAQTPAERVAGHRSFPPGFLWGSATASYQVEGAVHEGGRGLSIWDTFSHMPGKVDNGDTGDVADDFYHRYREDIQLMKNLGLKSFRFSVAWTRIFPNGTGAPNQQGVDFYLRLTDALLEAGIQPFCTLYHWDLPQVLQDRGGWENHDTAKAFADYAGYTVSKLGDRVKHYMTMNELRTFVEVGNQEGRHAPGLKLSRGRLAQLTHHVVLGHGMAVQAIRANAPAGTKVGVAENPVATTPVIESQEHIEAARKAFREENAMYLTVIKEGRYTEQYLKRLGSDAPKFTAEDLRIISSPMDFVGTNVYQPAYVRADANERGYAMAPPPASYPHMYSPWLTIGPEALYWVPKLVSELWDVREIYITENGTSSTDTIAADGHIYDTDRVMFLRNYLTQLQRAVSEGVPVRGYFLWSLLDNFEWADGYDKRFGITYVDLHTQKRTPKLSAKFYAEVIRTSRVA
ncbi:beta-glucosidase [Bryocella elongata]|uniref:Beta-glucosidase n=1 Tax=Bryocella elongata TaxID=863522 RepID=A0A1H5WNM2_9BACT|nr:GH1 family beta-glucosidase [Bryocella elongata]SEG00826.1 beta-glucosidase [Bryocella elongata]